MKVLQKKKKKTCFTNCSSSTKCVRALSNNKQKRRTSPAENRRSFENGNAFLHAFAHSATRAQNSFHIWTLGGDTLQCQRRAPGAVSHYFPPHLPLFILIIHENLESEPLAVNKRKGHFIIKLHFFFSRTDEGLGRMMDLKGHD